MEAGKPFGTPLESLWKWSSVQVVEYPWYRSKIASPTSRSASASRDEVLCTGFMDMRSASAAFLLQTRKKPGNCIVVR